MATEPLHIGFDGKRAALNRTGLGNYSRLLIEQMAVEYPRNRYTMYTPRLGQMPQLSHLLNLSNLTTVTPQGWFYRHLGSVWRSWGVTGCIKADKISLYHGLSGELPFNIARARIPSVVTVHDLIMRRHPEYYKPIDRAIYDFKFRRSAQIATRVIAISERTRNDLVELYNIDPDKIDVVYQGCDPQFNSRVTPAEIEQVRRIYGLNRPYILTVGTIEPRKNQRQAVAALWEMADEIDLVIVGRESQPYGKELRRYVGDTFLGDKVKIISNAPFAHLPALYAGAVASTYTSRYEGFGIPVIESLSVGTPVVVATGSCLEEAGGPDTPAVSPDDPYALAVTLHRLHNDPSYRAYVATRGQEYVKRFAPGNFASGVMEVYQKAIEQWKRNS